MEPKEIDKPWHVMAFFKGKQSFAAGHDDEEAATRDAEKKNEKAKQLGVDAVYTVVPRDLH